MSVDSARESGGGRIKAFLTVATSVISVVAALAKLSDTGHALISTIIFAFFVVYVAIDILWWRGYPAVWLFGPFTMLVAAYWWIGFMHKHGIPPDPVLPAGWYPTDLVYLALAGWIAMYGVWDIIDARVHRFRDEQTLVAGAVVLLIGVCICVFLTLRGPTGA